MLVSSRAALVLAILLTFPGAAASAGGVDLASGDGVTIGGADGKFVRWGGSVVLSDADAMVRVNGRCAFRVSYGMHNKGNSVTGQFKNYLVANGAAVAVNGQLTLAGSERRQVDARPYMTPGSYELVLKLDAEDSLAESNEANNRAAIHVTVKGRCDGGQAEPVS